MDRLTARTLGTTVSTTYYEDFIFSMTDEVYSAYSDIIDRLAAYEDTGLSPEEITALKADNERLHKLVDEVEDILKVTRKKEPRP